MDYTLLNLAVHLSANNNPEYKKQVINTSISLMHFFYDNKLLIDIEPFDKNGVIKADLVVKKSNVTVEGLELFKKPVQDWFKFIDKGGNPENVSRLSKALEKIRSK